MAHTPGFSGSGHGGSGFNDLDFWIWEFFSGAWLPSWGIVDITAPVIFPFPGDDTLVGDRRDYDPISNVPVGESDTTVVWPREGVSTVVPDITDISSTTILGETVPLTDAEWFELMHGGGGAGTYVPTTGAGEGADPMPTGIPTTWGGWYDWADDYWFGGELPGGTAPPPGNYVPNDGNGGNSSIPPVGDPTAPPGTTTMPTGNHLATNPSHYVYKLVNGQWKWVHKRKRRCKRLLTASQARDLQLLMSITGKSSELTKIIVARGGLC